MKPEQKPSSNEMRNVAGSPIESDALPQSAFRVLGSGVFDRWTLLACFAAGCFMVWGANAYTIFDDEALSCRLYATPMGEMVRALWRGEDPDPPMYYLFQNTWVRIFGVGPFALRGLSILFFLAGLIVIRKAADSWFDRRTGIATMAICCIHPAHLFFGFAGRWYSLMFLLVAALMCMSAGKPNTVGGRTLRGRAIAWGLLAAATCYTNYFGPAIVGLIWMGMVVRDCSDATRIRHHALSAVIAVALYIPWVPIFWHHVVSFPQVGGGFAALASSAARLGMTLLAGNLAGPAAWWVWGPMAVGLLCGLSILGREFREFSTLAFVVIATLAAGFLTRTLIDKYVMIVSGPFCMLMGAVLSRGLWKTRGDLSVTGSRRIAVMAVIGLSVGWIGCMVNLVTERHWSSLRWLDPFERVSRELYEQNWHRTYPDAVCSHPSARYYFALIRATDSHRSSIEKHIQPNEMLAPPKSAWDWTAAFRADPTEWLACLNEQDDGQAVEAWYAKTPTAILRRFEKGDRPELIITLETTGFVELSAWSELRSILIRHYHEADEPIFYLEDASADLKDRIDPAFKHPPWRITIRQWRLKPVSGA